MCGIVGYVGSRQAKTVLLGMMLRLEYRGYDSCGLATVETGVNLVKAAVRVQDLADRGMEMPGTYGIGHTRWASVGAVTQENAHPFMACDHAVVIAHNGNIKNFAELKKRLENSGHQFSSQTDSEVIAHLIEGYYHGDLADALGQAVKELDGPFAVIALHPDSRRLVAAVNGCPIVIGLGEGENWLASDVPALLEYTGRVIYLEDGDIAAVEADSVKICAKGRLVSRASQTIGWAPESVARAGYQHLMLKEIHEQPRIIRNIIQRKQSAWLPADSFGETTCGVLLIGCGSSYHACLAGKILIEGLSGIQANAELATELFDVTGSTRRYRAVIGLSQSGETADTCAALDRQRQAGFYTIAISNVPGSRITRLAEQTILTDAGPEISVAATKSFTAQLVTLLNMGLALPSKEPRRALDLTGELRALPAMLQRILDRENAHASAARWLASFKNIICIGRGILLPIALECALKLKEITYIHAEGCAAGELKHGTLALLSPATPVIAFMGTDETRAQMLTAIREVKARGVPVLAIAPEGEEDLEDLADRVILLPRTDPLLQPVLAAAAAQLLAYHTALSLDLPIDTPRNLAKSVTVE
ncbi:glutamine--fructose-6-phosphate transaminase (isomerizing) [Dehalogenimonas sp. 4OHTPN]|uniref:Glutamine--fructose-6-phosphate aminotransferase [isomerizing] n=1 Tax=Dehalogenimonas sp. 4OHTPN TaxID=3166643 RepID=A0AAU8G934_9CHLR